MPTPTIIFTAEDIATWRRSGHGSSCSVLLDEIERLQRRERDLIVVNNLDLERRRLAEADATQALFDSTVWRDELVRLRASLANLCGPIEEDTLA